MSLFSFIPLRSRLLAAAAVVAGLVSGACSAGLIALINTALNRAGLSRTLLVVGFAGLVASKVLSNAVARLLLNRFTQQTLADLCRDLSRKVLAAPLRHLEHVGIPRILATLTDDVAWLGWSAQNAPTLATNMAVLAGCAIYLGWLSWSILLVVALVIVIGMIGYRILTARAYRYLQGARDTRDVLFDHFRALTEGMKELKLHAARREAFLSERIATATEDLRRHALAGIRHHIVADTWSQILFYGLLGGLLFTAPSAQGANTATVFYLFDSLLGLRGDDLDARAHRHLVELELDAKIQIRDGALSTTALSQGQRKRLALLTAFLEDRPIYVFDEWAADQDSHYREVFYKRLLPELKGLGKTILVISHDDRYYHLGDRIVKLEYGKLAAERGPEDRHRDPTVDVAK